MSVFATGRTSSARTSKIREPSTRQMLIYNSQKLIEISRMLARNCEWLTMNFPLPRRDVISRILCRNCRLVIRNRQFLISIAGFLVIISESVINCRQMSVNNSKKLIKNSQILIRKCELLTRISENLLNKSRMKTAFWQDQDTILLFILIVV